MFLLSWSASLSLLHLSRGAIPLESTKSASPQERGVVDGGVQHALLDSLLPPNLVRRISLNVVDSSLHLRLHLCFSSVYVHYHRLHFIFSNDLVRTMAVSTGPWKSTIDCCRCTHTTPPSVNNNITEKNAEFTRQDARLDNMANHNHTVVDVCACHILYMFIFTVYIEDTWRAGLA